MVVEKISNVSNLVFKGIEQKKPAEEQKSTQEVKEDGKKKLVLALGALAVVGAAVAVGVTVAHKKKLPLPLSKINFDSGTAFHNNKKYTGVVEDVLKNGDKIRLKYVDGVIQSSERVGQNTFSKIFNYNADGALTSVQTKKGDDVRELIKTATGHIITENGILKKAFTKKEDGCIVADFINGKPIKSTKYGLDGIISSLKEYSYDKNNKLSQLNIYNADAYNPNLKLSQTTLFSPNGSSITTKSDNYGKIYTSRSIQTAKDGALPHGADICITKPERGYSNVTENKFYKDGKEVFYERIGGEIRVDDTYAPPYLQSNTHTFKNVLAEDTLTGTITQKRIYDTGAYDVLTEGGNWEGYNFKIQHFDPQGKTIGFTQRQCDDVSTGRSYWIGSQYHSGDKTYYYTDKRFDASGKLISQHSSFNTEVPETMHERYFGY